MFDVYCPGHGSRVLLFSGDIEAVRNTRGGIEVDYRCFCGHRGVWRTGRSFAEKGCSEVRLEKTEEPGRVAQGIR